MVRAPRGIRSAVERGTYRLAKAGIENPRFESELLLAHAIGVPRLWILTNSDARMSEDAVRRFASLIRRRRRREPAAYLLGEREFFSLRFRVGPGVLVPRPETELLVERAIEWSRRRRSPPRVLDVGTGSGAIAISLLVNVPRARAFAIDRSATALRYAAENARASGVQERLSLLRADLADLPRLFPRRSFDLVLSNPPYVHPDLVRDEIAHEPALALVGNSGDFPNVYQRLLLACDSLTSGGALIVEVGDGQASTVAGLFRASNRFDRVEIANDLAGVPRIVIASGAGE